MIRLRHLSKRLGATPIIEDVSLTVRSGEILCLAGPSGVGKTTLLELAAGLVRPDAGSVDLDVRRKGCLFQDDILAPWLTALDNVLLALRGLGPLTSDVRANALRWLSHYDLPPERKPTRMSGGMRRRLNLARALAVAPDVLLLDEPLAFLDQAWQDTVVADIAAAQARGCATLLVSHQLEPLRGLACTVVEVAHTPLRLHLP